MNTYFYKEDKHLCTYKDIGIKGPPYKRHRYETLDYISTTNNWKNTIKDIQADPEANIDTRHHPLTAKVHIKIKQNTKNSNTRKKQQTQIQTMYKTTKRMVQSASTRSKTSTKNNHKQLRSIFHKN